MFSVFSVASPALNFILRYAFLSSTLFFKNKLLSKLFLSGIITLDKVSLAKLFSSYGDIFFLANFF